jgi:hypothetical protein
MEHITIKYSTQISITLLTTPSSENSTIITINVS